MRNNTYIYSNEFQLECGATLNGIQINYSFAGTLNAKQDNVIWICHALTANSDPTVWWSELVGEGKFYNPEKHFIICANVLSSCYGTTGPLEIDRNTGKPYYRSLPLITIRDMVAAHELLRTHLGIEKIHTCIGGSVGGQQAMEWAIAQPQLIEHLVLMCTNAFHSPWGIAFNEAQRMALNADPTFEDENENAGKEGMKAARALALLSYRNYETYAKTQTDTDTEKLDDFKATSYQKYQGEKLEKRFNAHSYWYLSKAMDSHNVGRGRNGAEAALKTIEAKTLVIGITSDLLFPISEQQYLADHIPAAQYEAIESLYGHDGFLIETATIKGILERFYKG